jgi:Sigma-70, region 4
VVRLSHQYTSCPSCQLILPLDDDSDTAAGHHIGADGRDGVLPLRVARCGLCKHPLDTVTPWPLGLKLGCPDCGALIRGPTEAAVLACLGCDRYFANPSNSPEVRQRVRGTMAEQARIAELVNDLDRRLEQVLAEAERQHAALAPLLAPCGHRLADPGGWSAVCLLPVGHPGPHGLPGWPPPPRRRERTRVPEEWIDQTRPLPQVFADAFIMAVEGLESPRERLVAELRYGLDGAPGRTFRQLGQALGRSPARARQLLWRAVRNIALAPLGPDPTWSPSRRACGVAVHLATDVLGDPIDPQTPARIRAFVDQALPLTRPQVSAQLLIELADLVELEVDLRAWGRDQALCRAVAAVHLSR